MFPGDDKRKDDFPPERSPETSLQGSQGLASSPFHSSIHQAGLMNKAPTYDYYHTGPQIERAYVNGSPRLPSLQNHKSPQATGRPRLPRRLPSEVNLIHAMSKRQQW